jgi:hypothetical protein
MCNLHTTLVSNEMSRFSLMKLHSIENSYHMVEYDRHDEYHREMQLMSTKNQRYDLKIDFQLTFSFSYLHENDLFLTFGDRRTDVAIRKEFFVFSQVRQHAFVLNRMFSNNDECESLAITVMHVAIGQDCFHTTSRGSLSFLLIRQMFVRLFEGLTIILCTSSVRTVGIVKTCRLQELDVSISVD